MPKFKFIYLIVFLFLFGCSDTPQQPTAALYTPTQRSPVKLPPTWTPTVFLPPSETPIRPATLTFTPLPSVTPLPATITISPTSNVPTLSVTPTIKPTLVSDCDFLALDEGVDLHTVPFDESYNLLPTMIPSVAYQAISYHPPYYELMLDGKSVGWADYRLLSVSSEGSGCSNLPIDNREIYEFSSLCFFTTDNRAVDVYRDKELTVYSETISGTRPHRIVLRYKDVYYSNNGIGTPYNYVDAGQVRIFGACERIPKAGEIITDSILWSQPNGQFGEQVASVPEGSMIAVQEGPVQGPKPPEASELGYWYLVKVPLHQDGTPSGWIWSSFFEFE